MRAETNPCKIPLLNMKETFDALAQKMREIENEDQEGTRKVHKILTIVN